VGAFFGGIQAKTGQGNLELSAADGLLQHRRGTAGERHVAVRRPGDDHYRHMGQSAVFTNSPQKRPAVGARQLEIERYQTEGVLRCHFEGGLGTCGAQDAEALLPKQQADQVGDAVIVLDHQRDALTC
jgi:hypothetical protein